MAYNFLLVDDSRAMRMFVRRVLNLSSLEIGNCFEANNGEEGLTVLAQERVDVVLTDVNMPVMNGEQFLQKLAGDGKLTELPVIVVSTDSTASRIGRMMELGARGYVTKPFTPEMLSDEVARAMGATNAVA